MTPEAKRGLTDQEIDALLDRAVVRRQMTQRREKTMKAEGRLVTGSGRRQPNVAAAARRRFPGADPPDTHLREAFELIVAAGCPSASAAQILAQLRNVVFDDPEELSDSRFAGATMVEITLGNLVGELEASARACRQAAAALRRTRRRSPARAPRQKLKVVR